MGLKQDLICAGPWGTGSMCTSDLELLYSGNEFSASDTSAAWVKNNIIEKLKGNIIFNSA